MPFLSGCARPVEPPPRLVVLGLDGATWDVIDPLIERGALPTIAKLKRQGAWAVLHSEPPLASPVVWTTIFTGKGADEHGIDRWEAARSTNRRVKALWTVANDAGQQVVISNIPGTYPPDRLGGIEISGFPLPNMAAAVMAGVYDLRPLEQSRIRHGGTAWEAGPAGKAGFHLLESGNGSTVLVVTGSQKTHAVRLNDAWSDWIPWDNPAGAFRVKRIPGPDGPRLFVTPVFMRDLPFTAPPGYRERLQDGRPYVVEGLPWHHPMFNHEDVEAYRALFEHLLAVHDQHAAAIVELARGGGWNLFLHVFTLIDRISHRYWRYRSPANGTTDPAMVAAHDTRVEEAYVATDTAIGRLLEVIGPDVPVVLLSDHGFVGGVHDERGILLIAGPGVRHIALPPAHIRDVMPTLLYMARLPVARDLRGQLLTAAFSPVTLAAHPPTWVPSHESTQTPRPASVETIDPATREQLRSLGYLE